MVHPMRMAVQDTSQSAVARIPDANGLVSAPRINEVLPAPTNRCRRCRMAAQR
ncbi:hypothetical protein MHBO_002135 [Bonamia ostreae]|uniref:Uncharacterized protein n=1 Tax=Bonamia ostreae TaxID=126728 RepID=A0ABV2ALD8_9EUKA